MIWIIFLLSWHLYCISSSFFSLHHRWRNGSLPLNWIIAGGLLYGRTTKTGNLSKTFCQDKGTWCLESYCYYQWLFIALLICLRISEGFQGDVASHLLFHKIFLHLAVKKKKKSWKPTASFSLLCKLSRSKKSLQQSYTIKLESKVMESNIWWASPTCQVLF